MACNGFTDPDEPEQGAGVDDILRLDTPVRSVKGRHP
jgi:hypothetical protein